MMADPFFRRDDEDTLMLAVLVCLLALLLM